MATMEGEKILGVSTPPTTYRTYLIKALSELDSWLSESFFFEGR